MTHAETAAEQAFARYSALRRAERKQPSLMDDPAHVEKTERAYSEFLDAFGKCS